MSYAPPEPRTRNGLTIAGFILAILIPPIGLILCIIGLVQAGRRGQKGKVLAVLGIIISLLLPSAVVAAVVVAGSNVTTVADPGCTSGKAAILDNSKVDENDVEAMKASLQTTIDGLDAAAAKAKHDNVRDAMKALADDYRQLLAALNGGTAPDTLMDKITNDANKIDELCTIGGAE